MNVTWKNIAIGLAALLIGGAVKFFLPSNKITDAIELVAEEVAENQTGIDIDINGDGK